MLHSFYWTFCSPRRQFTFYCFFIPEICNLHKTVVAYVRRIRLFFQKFFAKKYTKKTQTQLKVVQSKYMWMDDGEEGGEVEWKTFKTKCISISFYSRRAHKTTEYCESFVSILISYTAVVWTINRQASRHAGRQCVKIEKKKQTLIENHSSFKREKKTKGNTEREREGWREHIFWVVRLHWAPMRYSMFGFVFIIVIITVVVRFLLGVCVRRTYVCMRYGFSNPLSIEEMKGDENKRNCKNNRISASMYYMHVPFFLSF